MKPVFVGLFSTLIAISAQAGRTYCSDATGRVSYQTFSHDEGSFMDNAVVESLKFDRRILKEARLKRNEGGRLEITTSNPALQIEMTPLGNEEPVVDGVRFTLELVLKTTSSVPLPDFFDRAILLECLRSTKSRFDNQAPQTTNQARPIAK